ncbi:MAG: hypothetical protein WC900_06790 [Oscillospiraceae bacterium]
MCSFRIITEQYCPLLQQNIALEKTITGGEERLQCLNKSQCSCKDGGCLNQLLNINSLISHDKQVH